MTRRLLLDASTLASGIAGRRHRGPSARLVEAVLSATVQAVACPLLLTEVDRALAKPYFRTKITESQTRDVLAELTARAVLLSDPIDPPRVLRDAGDDISWSWPPPATRS